MPVCCMAVMFSRTTADAPYRFPYCLPVKVGSIMLSGEQGFIGVPSKHHETKDSLFASLRRRHDPTVFILHFFSA
jgi:hypothetical protein